MFAPLTVLNLGYTQSTTFCGTVKEQHMDAIKRILAVIDPTKEQQHSLSRSIDLAKKSGATIRFSQYLRLLLRNDNDAFC